MSVAAPVSGADWGFTDVTGQAGVGYEYGLGTDTGEDQLAIIGGVAAGDYDGDGWVDLYLVTGQGAPNVLLRNLGDGTFTDTAAAAGVAQAGFHDSGPLFADFDGDGHTDLFVGGLRDHSPHVFRNRGDGTFETVTGHTDWPADMDYVGAAAGDYDGDGDLDLATSHWGEPNRIFLWRNDGNFSFTSVGLQAGVGGGDIRPYGFAPTFADINNDGAPDLLYVSDFGTTEFFHNDGAGGFVRMTSEVITDDNGMGSAVGDYDNDGDLDWFVSSISQEEGTRLAFTGNRLYRNAGDGTFEDATDQAGVKRGYWGWGACFADFDNDGWLDLFHVNGFDVFPEPVWATDPSRLFMNNRDGSFTERAVELGIDDRRSGRGVVCFDYDRDGDLDIFISNRNAPHRLYRNDGGHDQGGFLQFAIVDEDPAPHAGNAVMRLSTGQGKQMREIRFGSNFVSNNPPVLHFGLGADSRAQQVEITWPDGQTQALGNVPGNQFVRIVRDAHSHASTHQVPAVSRSGLAILAGLILGTMIGFRFLTGHRS